MAHGEGAESLVRHGCAAIRLFLAVSAAGAAWVALSERYDCTIPVGIFTLFYALTVVFMAGFVWAVSEVAWAFTARVTASILSARLTALAVGVVVYLAIAGIAWLMNPVPHDARHDAPYRAVLSVFWSAGFLQEAGHYSDYSCGY